MADVQDLHANFLKKYPTLKISLAAFRALRPRQCIPVGAKGTHNVCVCKIHGNIRLKMRGLKEEFARKKFNFETPYRDYLKKMVCSKSKDDCFLAICKKCPGAKKALKDLEKIMQQFKIKNVNFNQWLTTDRYCI